MRVVARQGPRVLLGALGLAVIVWLIIKATQAGQTFLTETLNGLTLAALYFVVAAGFTLIFGLMRVVNMAQGSLYLFGGYVAFTSRRVTGSRAGHRSSSSVARPPRASPAGSSRSCSRRW